ncbi:MAG: hypothetical protein K6A38_09385 [Lachnospiraceae bacterium]|nr:hypothetical protein [Lachnospiraceae bacterium]
MPTGLIFFLVVFIIIVYVYTFIKWRKRRKSNKESEIDKFKSKYIDKVDRNKYINTDNTDKNGDTEDLRIDYIDKNEYISEIQAAVHASDYLNDAEKKKFELKF